MEALIFAAYGFVNGHGDSRHNGMAAVL